MTYTIQGLNPAAFAPLFSLSDAELAAAGAVRVVADGPGFPCRVSLADAQAGEALILLHYTSHDVATPYRSSYAIYVREDAAEAPCFVDQTPPVFEGRVLALRGFRADGMIKEAVLAQPGEADAHISALFADSDIAYIHAHNAVYGCFSAKVERHG